MRGGVCVCVCMYVCATCAGVNDMRTSRSPHKIKSTQVKAPLRPTSLPHWHNSHTALTRRRQLDCAWAFACVFIILACVFIILLCFYAFMLLLACLFTSYPFSFASTWSS